MIHWEAHPDGAVCSPFDVVLDPRSFTSSYFCAAASIPQSRDFRLFFCRRICCAWLLHGTLIDTAFDGIIRVRRYLCQACQGTVSRCTVHLVTIDNLAFGEKAGRQLANTRKYFMSNEMLGRALYEIGPK